MKKRQVLYCLSIALAACTVLLLCSSTDSYKSRNFKADIEQTIESETVDHSNFDDDFSNGALASYSSIQRLNHHASAANKALDSKLNNSQGHKLFLIYKQLKLHI
ncbi:hypothetical protein [Roseivirga pacifica]|uniref:hypothetical protein n=1 Tax=Roseivirga pacifica TaxID=1267423 RepID=UPI003BAE9F0C